METLVEKKDKKQKKEVLSNDPKPKNKFFSHLLVKLQGLGKSLMYPIALLPFAALLNRFGSLAMELNPVQAGSPNAGWWIGFIIGKPGATIFDNLPLLFAIGTAFGLSKDQRGEAALVGAAFYLILVTMLNEGGLPKLFYSKVNTFSAWGQVEQTDSSKIWQDGAGGSFSSLFYVP
ncbi:PTS transporter subunit EIIC [Spiroplasma helicoides]|uniref:PTS transporter subunit EIIC n=1 Tax=Spiroplasma helicoides TaxID=216938 RepID=UPI00083F6166|nr:PTS transporter subunit EIIC [Spiroplasma helicoides]